MKRLISTVLAVVMLLSMFAISAFAEGEIEIITDPQDAEVEYGAPVTLTVEAEGENLQYQWYAWTVYGVWPLYDDEHGVEGADTASLTILSSDCRMNAIYFYCEVGNGVDFEDSDTAAVTVPHQPAGDYIYDASTHRVVCVCDTIMEAEGHTVVTGACVCGYDAANPVIQPPTILEDEIDYDHNVETGEDVELTVVAYGLELTYQWSWYNMDNDQFVPLTDNEHYVGTATDTLTVKNLQCNEDFRWYFCTVSNSEGSERTDGYSIYVNHKYDQLFADPFGHGDACVCGDNTGVYNHYDFDEDRICDECEYVFDAAAPKITSYSEDVAVENGHEPVTFKVVASGEGLTYQWFDWNGEALADDERYSGTNTATLTVTSVYDPESGLYDCADQCAYYCVVSNDKGALESEWMYYEVEHAEVDYAETMDEFHHEEYCVCGGWMNVGYHVDADEDALCDLCEGDFIHPFEDVTDPEAWYYDAALYTRANNIFLGAYGNLLPDDEITRGEVATVLGRLAVTQDVIDMLDDVEFEELLTYIADTCGTTPVEFTDIDGTFYERHARVAAAFGLINGYEDGEFRGEEKISREELAVVLMRFNYLIVDTVGLDLEDIQMENPVESFNDAALISDWAAEDVDAARSIGLFCGDENGNFNPTAGATRAEAAQTLMRMETTPGLLLLLVVFGDAAM